MRAATSQNPFRIAGSVFAQKQQRPLVTVAADTRSGLTSVFRPRRSPHIMGCTASLGREATLAEVANAQHGDAGLVSVDPKLSLVAFAT